MSRRIIDVLQRESFPEIRNLFHFSPCSIGN
jgi:hypothetical protein